MQPLPNPQTESVIVIGGGVAGLTAALHLAERGVLTLLLEADPEYIGGRLRGGHCVTLSQHGQSWSFPGEHGVHGIWNSYVNLKALLTRHDILPQLWPSPDEAWIHAEGKRVQRAAMGRAIHTSPIPAPLHYLHLFTRWRFLNMLSPADLVTLPRVMGTLLVALVYDPIGEQNPLNNESLASFTKGWSPRVRSFFAGLARNALAAHPEDAPAAGFVAFLRFYTIARRDAWKFAFLPGTGGNTIAEPLAQTARRYGANIRQGARVVRLNQHDRTWQVVYQTDAGEEAAQASHVILALDAPSCAQLLRTSPAMSGAAASLWFPKGVPTAILRIWYEHKPPTLAPTGILSGDMIVDNFFWLDAFQPEYAAWANATGGAALEMHIYGPPEVLEQPDAALLARAVSDAARAFPGGGHVVHAEIIRNPATHTLFGVSQLGTHLAIETPWPGVFACGDWVAHPAPAMYLERATTTGIAAANAVLQQRSMAPWPILPHPEPEPLARSIGGWLSKVRRRAAKRRG